MMKNTGTPLIYLTITLIITKTSAYKVIYNNSRIK